MTVYKEIEIDLTPKELLDVYDGMSSEDQADVLGDLEKHFDDLKKEQDWLESSSCWIAEACNLSIYDYQRVNQYLARYGFKLLRSI